MAAEQQFGLDELQEHLINQMVEGWGQPDAFAAPQELAYAVADDFNDPALMYQLEEEMVPMEMNEGEAMADMENLDFLGEPAVPEYQYAQGDDNINHLNQPLPEGFWQAGQNLQYQGPAIQDEFIPLPDDFVFQQEPYPQQELYPQQLPMVPVMIPVLTMVPVFVPAAMAPVLDGVIGMNNMGGVAQDAEGGFYDVAGGNNMEGDQHFLPMDGNFDYNMP